MKRSAMAGGAAVLASWLAFAAPAANAQPRPPASNFVVFDSTLYSNKPDLSAYGIRPVTLVGSGTFDPNWKQQPDVPPSVAQVQAAAAAAVRKGNPVVLDIEHWPLAGAPSLVQDSLGKYLLVLERFRAAAPTLSVGYYGAPPLRDYWRAIKDPASPEYKAWMQENDGGRPLADAVDVLFPSLYTFYPDQAGWKKYAIAQIAEARRIGKGKPVYVFLWPQYHDSNRQIGGTYLPPDFWSLQLNTAREHADGIVIWGGWGTDNRPAQWDDKAPWWERTQAFMQTVRKR